MNTPTHATTTKEVENDVKSKLESYSPAILLSIRILPYLIGIMVFISIVIIILESTYISNENEIVSTIGKQLINLNLVVGSSVGIILSFLCLVVIMATCACSLTCLNFNPIGGTYAGPLIWPPSRVQSYTPSYTPS